jgi:transcriptional regulator with XRE-family HTH domain
MVAMAHKKKWTEIEQMGQRIREAREGLGLTQEELGTLIGRNRETISHYEIGNRAIAVTELPTLAQALKVPVGYFFGDEVPPSEILALLSAELDTIPPSKQKAVLERIRFELEWWKKHDIEFKGLSSAD